LIVVDTNVILDISGNDGSWRNWSIEQLAVALQDGPAVINEVVFAELCSHQTDVTAVETLISGLGLKLMPMSPRALFFAGKAYVQYRRSGGTKLNVLPDFFVGAQATDLGASLLTRDARRYRTYFPQLELIAP
jgi:predicted nucleic acid-binding protein